MSEFLAAFAGSVEFANPEYLMVVPIAALLLVFGLVIFGLRYFLRPVKTQGSSYPLVGPIKFWFLLALSLVLVAAAAARPTNTPPETCMSPYAVKTTSGTISGML